MRKLRRSEDGAAAIEFGLILPILLVFLGLVGPLVKYGYDYMVLQRAAAHGVRFASRADVNVRERADGTLGRRPLPSEVATFVSDSSGGKVDASTVTVTPDPTLSLPGEQITVAIDYTVSYGVLGDVANAVKNVLCKGCGEEFLLPPDVTVSARGREE